MASLKAVSPLALLAHHVDDVGAVLPRRDHVRDQLGRVLEVGVEHRDGVAARVLEAGGERRLVAEVAREVDDAQARVARGERGRGCSGVLSRQPSLTMISS